MVSVCLPSDALLQHLPSYLDFSYLGRGVSLHGCSSKAQRLLLTLEEGYLLTAALPDLQCGIAPLGPPAPTQPPLLGHGVAPPGCCPWPRAWDGSSRPPLALDAGWLLSAATPDLRHVVAPLGHSCAVAAWHSRPLPRPWMRGRSSWPFLHCCSLALLAAAPDLGHVVTPLGHHPWGMGSSRLLPLTLDMG